ncbi:MAG: Gfo/Idh/MocA family oxidoreductase [Candidatus Hydrogenedentes bacterium]|nr:Gfo/Idh/MocA family oxidoreductase [Candidatus Hydrogenedentota bacterium]
MMSTKYDQQKQQEVSRRGFMRDAMAVAAGAGMAAGAAKTARADVYKSILPSTVLGANEIIRTGHIGVGGMGRADLKFTLMRDDMMPIAICDLYPKQLADDRAGGMAKSKNPNVTTHHDFREIIDNKDVDAVVIATPDHWHCLPVLYAADAGKDIYCEKPLSTTLAEANAMMKKIADTKVVFQGGTMQRSGEQFQQAVELVRSGYIGKVAHVETYIHDDEPITGIGMGSDADNLEKDQKVPYSLVDWNFHQGWVEHKPFNSNRWIYNFRWFLDYSGGKITDWGAHLIDIAIWAMGQEKQPKTVVATGGKYILQDNRTTPDTLEVLWEFEDYTMSFKNRVWNEFVPIARVSDSGKPVPWGPHGIVFHGTLGTLRVDRGGYQVYPVQNNGKPAEEKSFQADEPELTMNHPHWQNFADCIRSRERCICDAPVIGQTTTLCHMGTAAYVSGGKLRWNAEIRKFDGDDAATQRANEFAYRPYLNGWSLEAPYYRA